MTGPVGSSLTVNTAIGGTHERRRQGRGQGPAEGGGRRADGRRLAEERGQGRPRDRLCQGRRRQGRRQGQGRRQPEGLTRRTARSGGGPAPPTENVLSVRRWGTPSHRGDGSRR